MNEPQLTQDFSTVSQPASPMTLPKKRRKWPWVLLALLLLVAAAGGAGFWYYNDNLTAVHPGQDQPQAFVIEQGAMVSQIAAELESDGLIKNQQVFSLYARLNSLGDKFQAGTFLLRPSMSTPEIINDIITGKTKQMLVTLYPGVPLNFRNTLNAPTLSHRESLKKAGYTDQEITQAFAKKYDHPLLKHFPEAKSLEGLILGETYIFALGTPIDQVLLTTFDHYQQILDKNQILEGFKNQKLTSYQGIILASIVERESANIDFETKRKVAQVFLRRFREGMQLGSDVTYQYASRLAGVENDLYIDSPYNTRKYPGLPPGPISSPGVDALRAVANPAETNYLYFVDGDDDLTYFANTNAEHEANVRQHCKVKCLAM